VSSWKNEELADRIYKWTWAVAVLSGILVIIAIFGH